MSLPLTLAVLDGMVVKVADQTLVVPLNSILETMKPKGGEVYGLGPDSQVHRHPRRLHAADRRRLRARLPLEPRRSDVRRRRC